jgi:hypothetical protein
VAPANSALIVLVVPLETAGTVMKNFPIASTVAVELGIVAQSRIGTLSTRRLATPGRWVSDGTEVMLAYGVDAVGYAPSLTALP